MNYTPGLHILAEFSAANSTLLLESAASQTFFNQLISQYQLQQVGCVYHDFPNGGFTAVVCLTESHLSIHTWPEFGLATFDIFLSNYQKDNTEKTRMIYQDVLTFYGATVLSSKEIIR